jgi:hypothetical protein
MRGLRTNRRSDGGLRSRRPRCFAISRDLARGVITYGGHHMSSVNSYNFFDTALASTGKYSVRRRRRWAEGADCADSDG